VTARRTYTIDEGELAVFSPLSASHFPAPVRMTTEYAFEGRWDPVMTWTVESLLKDDLVGPAASLPPRPFLLMGARPRSQLFFLRSPPALHYQPGQTGCTTSSTDTVLCVQEDKMFEVAHPWGQDPKRACKRVSGGWPQLHLFSHYLRI